MLRRAAEPKGLCADCAVTEWLQNTSPVNTLLAESQHGPRVLLVPELREQFTLIMEAAGSEMRPAEINWERVVRQWDLPFPGGRGRRRARPVPTPGHESRREPLGGAASHLPMTLTSFEQLDELSPGLGEALRGAIRGGREEEA